MKKMGCLGGIFSLMFLGMGVIFVCVLFFSLMDGMGRAVLPPAYQEAYERWLAGEMPDDPAFEVVTDAFTGDVPPCQPSEMAWPVVDEGYFTQGFDEALHHGVDIGLIEGTPVGSPSDGVVVWAGYDYSGYGNLVVVANGETRFYLAHLSEVTVSPGHRVEAGETVGLSGNTGFSTGPHLHFEVRVNGSAVNPFLLMGQQVCTTAEGGTGGTTGIAFAPAVRWSLPDGWRGYAHQAVLDPSPKPGAALVRVAGPDRLYVWPDGFPEMAVEDGGAFRNTEAVLFGPQPGVVWGRVIVVPDTETLLSVWREGTP